MTAFKISEVVRGRITMRALLLIAVCLLCGCEATLNECFNIYKDVPLTKAERIAKEKLDNLSQ